MSVLSLFFKVIVKVVVWIGLLKSRLMGSLLACSDNTLSSVAYTLLLLLIRLLDLLIFFFLMSLSLSPPVLSKEPFFL